MKVIDTITCDEKNVTTAQFKFVSVDDSGSSIPLLAVLRPNVKDYIKELLKSNI